MEALVWPQRKRCRACRRFWPEPTIKGMFCSMTCAGLPEPGVDLEQAPRGCKVRTLGPPGSPFWAWKVRYRTQEEAMRVPQPGLTVYECDHCGHWHRSTRGQRKENS